MPLANITSPIRTRNRQCFLPLADARLAMCISTTNVGSPNKSVMSTGAGYNKYTQPTYDIGLPLYALEG